MRGSRTNVEIRPAAQGKSVKQLAAASTSKNSSEWNSQQEKAASSSSDAPDAGNPHQRSCITCRRRKTKCDKGSPCSGCVKSQFECVYPPPRQSRRKPKIDSNVALKARLEKLEGLVKNLDKKNGPKISPADRRNGVDPESGKREIGRLIVEEGEKRYIENSFWVALSTELLLQSAQNFALTADQVSELRDLLNGASDNDSEGTTPPPASGDQAYIYSFNSLVSNLAGLHPNPNQISLLWRIFMTNVDPVVRMLHKPTMQVEIMKAKDNLEGVSRPFEALMFAIYFSSITSLAPEDCTRLFQEAKESLLSRFRFGVEQALARAGFLSSHNLLTLQALIIFLVCERNHDETRLVWTLTGVAIRLATSLGIHRDGSNFNLSVFEAEMRRRVWWQICVLDIRTAENLGADQDVAQQSFDTALPLNVNDDMLDPAAVEPVVPEVGITEMSLSLIRYEIIKILWQLRFTSKEADQGITLSAALSAKEKIDRITEDCNSLLESKYLKYCDLTIPFHWFLATVARMMLAKMWINAQHRFAFQFDFGVDAIMTARCKHHLFMVSVEIVESCLQLEREKSTRQWKWAFRNYVPWQALAYILSQLSVCGPDDKKNQAWPVVQSAFEQWGDLAANSGKDVLWLRMKQLLSKAKRYRLPEQGRNPQATSLIDHQTDPGQPPMSFVNPDYFEDNLILRGADGPDLVPTTMIDFDSSQNMMAGIETQANPALQWSSMGNGLEFMEGSVGDVLELDKWMMTIDPELISADNLVQAGQGLGEVDRWW